MGAEPNRGDVGIAALTKYKIGCSANKPSTFFKVHIFIGS